MFEVIYNEAHPLVKGAPDKILRTDNDPDRLWVVPAKSLFHRPTYRSAI
jgi:hypothetical protein